MTEEPDFIIAAVPTRTVTRVEVDGVEIHARLWKGVTKAGTKVYMLVLGIIPHDGYGDSLRAELPEFMIEEDAAIAAAPDRKTQ